MDDRLTGGVAAAVGLSLAAVGTVVYILPGLAIPPWDPLATGVFIVVTGLLLVGAGALAVVRSWDDLALRATVGVGAVTLLLAVAAPQALRFGGVLWLALIALGLVGAGAYRTVVHSR